MICVQINRRRKLVLNLLTNVNAWQNEFVVILHLKKEVIMKFGLFRRRGKTTKFISFNSHNCEACWKCVEACTQNVLGKIEVFNHRHACIDEPDNCTGCRKCVNACGFNALSYINR